MVVAVVEMQDLTNEVECGAAAVLVDVPPENRERE